MRRVVITGVGIVNCLGSSADGIRDALREGRSGIDVIPERKELGFYSCLAGRAHEFTLPKLSKRLARQMGDCAKMAYSVALQAIDDAGLGNNLIQHDRTGVVIGNSGNMHEVFDLCNMAYALKKSLPGVALPRGMASSVSANLSVLLGTRGPCYTVSTACASGATAIGQAAQLIRCGLQDRVLAGGAQEDSWEYDRLFDALRVFSDREDRPTEACRPFDKDRDGTVPSAGVGLIVLEEFEQAKSRGAQIYAELAGCGINSDGQDMTTASGIGGAKCMEMALADAGIPPEQVDYVNAHATATPVGDVLEANSIARVFGDRPLVSSTKLMTGHEKGAAGSNELIYTLLMMRDGFVAPNINIEQIDEECQGINLVANQAVDASIDVALSNSFGLGGVNTSLVVKRLN